MKIIGIAGLPRSGKDSLAEILIENGYFGFSLGDYVRTRARDRHADKDDPISVENMTETSNYLRETYGADIVLKEALKEFERVNHDGRYKGVALFSVRAPVEVDFILENDGQLIWVEASAEVRHERGLTARREGEPEISLEEFKRQEALQWQPQSGIPDEVQMNVAYVKDHATIIIENNQNDLIEFNNLVTERLAEFL